MSLAPYDQRELAKIEYGLRRADPQLDTMLARGTLKGARWRAVLLFFRRPQPLR